MARAAARHRSSLRFEQLERRDTPSSGGLDPSFGDEGKVTTSFGPGPDKAQAVTIDGLGRIVVAGYADTGGDPNTDSYDFAVARFNADGTPDLSFGSTGRVTVPVGDGDDVGRAVAIDASGRIVVVGYTFISGGDSDFALARLNPDGSLDLSFGTGGVVVTPYGTGADQAHCVAVYSSGKIVIAGTADVGGVVFALAQYSADGSLDGSFGTVGKVTTPIGAGAIANDLAIDGAGRIVVAGSSQNANGNSRFTVARYTTGGILDGSFGTGGIVSTAMSSGDIGNGVAIDALGRIVTAGYSSINGSDFSLARYSDNGDLDTSLGAFGTVSTDFALNSADFGMSVLVDELGRIIVAGHTSLAGSEGFALTRYLTDGSLDPSFGSGGKVATFFGITQDQANSISIDDRGRLILAGFTSKGAGDFDFAIARYLANDAPRLTDDAVLPAIPQGAASPPGRKVSSLFAGLFADPNVGDTFTGIAVVGNPLDTDQGVWQYSTDDGATWFDIGAVADDASALALATTTRLRFVPQPGFSGDPAPLVVRAFDSTFTGGFTNGATRQTVDTSVNGNDSPISAENAEVLTSVFPSSTSSAASLLPSGDLSIIGTADDDTIEVDVSSDLMTLSVIINGQTKGDFAQSAVTGKIVVSGLAGNDVITFSPWIVTSAVLHGNSGDDTLLSGGGNDLLDGGSGDDMLAGGAGNDTYRFAGSWGVDVVQESASAGNDRLDFSAAAGDITFTIGSSLTARLQTNLVTGASIENLAGGVGNDTFGFTKGKSLAGVIEGGLGTDTLNFAAFTTAVRVNLLLGTATATGGVAGIENVTAGSGSDILVGDQSANRLLGGIGRDILIGGLGADELRGGRGTDVLVGAATAHDDDAAALELLMLEWRRAIAFGTRVRHLLGTLGGGLNGTSLLNGTTIQNDNVSDALLGNPGVDWFLIHSGESTPDRAATERVTLL
jgi:uncharacterized delta-60 repeat protein